MKVCLTQNVECMIVFLMCLSVAANAGQSNSRHPESDGLKSGAKTKGEVYWSPDHKLRAIVITLPPRSYGGPESKVEIRTADGRLLAHASYASATGAQGYGVVSPTWTANSSFFVYSLENVGGHSPWHWPTAFYSRQHHHLYSLDSTLGGLSRKSGNSQGDGAITERLKLVNSCKVTTRGRVSSDVYAVTVRSTPTQAADNSKDIFGKELTIDLCRIDNVLTRADEERSRLRY